MADNTCSMASVSSVSSGCNFSAAENRRFRHQLFEALEELRVRRAMDSENEERIKQLVHEKHRLEIKVEKTEKERKEAVLREEERVTNVKEQQQQLIKELQQDKKKMSVSSQVIEEEQKSLKDEIRTLELCKYNLEKRVKELEQKLERKHVAGSVSDNQLMEVEHVTERLKKRVNDLTRQVDRLQKNVEASETMNTKLWALCEEQKVEICDNKQQNNKLNSELVKVRIKADNLPCDMLDKLSVLQGEKETLSNSLKTKEDAINRLKSELSEAKQLTQDKSDCLKDAHKLLERHMEAEHSVKQDFNMCKIELSEETEKHNKLKEKFDEVCRDREVEVHTHENTRLQWKKQMASLTEEVENLKETISKQKVSLSELEELNSTWSEKNLQLTQHINQLKSEREKPSRDTEVQVQPVVMETEIQTEAVAMETVNTQVTTETEDKGTETITSGSVDSAVQTELLDDSQQLKMMSSQLKMTSSPVTTNSDTRNNTVEESAAEIKIEQKATVHIGVDTPAKVDAENYSSESAAEDAAGNDAIKNIDTENNDKHNPDTDIEISENDDTIDGQLTCKDTSENTVGEIPSASNSTVDEMTSSRNNVDCSPELVPSSQEDSQTGGTMSPAQRFLLNMKQISGSSETSREPEKQHQLEREKNDYTSNLRTRLQKNSSLSRTNRLSLARHSFLNFPEPSTPRPDVSIATTQANPTPKEHHLGNHHSPSNGSEVASLSEILSTDDVTRNNQTHSSVTMETRRDTMTTDVNKRPVGILHNRTCSPGAKRRRKSVTFSDL